MKKFMVITLSFMLMLSMSACGGKDQQAEDPTATEVAVATQDQTKDEAVESNDDTVDESQDATNEEVNDSSEEQKQDTEEPEEKDTSKKKKKTTKKDESSTAGDEPVTPSDLAWDAPRTEDYTNDVPQPEFEYEVIHESKAYGMDIDCSEASAEEIEAYRQSLLDAGFTEDTDNGDGLWQVSDSTRIIYYDGSLITFVLI